MVALLVEVISLVPDNTTRLGTSLVTKPLIASKNLIDTKVLRCLEKQLTWFQMTHPGQELCFLTNQHFAPIFATTSQIGEDLMKNFYDYLHWI